MPRPLTFGLLDPALIAAQRHYVAQAQAWVQAQASRLRVEPENILLAIKSGYFPEDVERCSGPTGFLAMMAGRSIVATHPLALAMLKKHRAYFGDAPSAVVAPGTIAAHHREVELAQHRKRERRERQLAA